MPPTRRVLTSLTLITAGVLAGCGTNTDCTLTPLVNTAPSACNLQPSSTVTVNVRWCSCGATTRCQASGESGGVIQLEPVVNSCDASCPDNPTSCPATPTQCTFDTPGSGTYHLYVISGQDFLDVPLTVGNAGGTSCG